MYSYNENGYIIPPQHTPRILSPDEQRAAQDMIEKTGYFNPEQLNDYLDANRFKQDAKFQKEHPIANAWWNMFTSGMKSGNPTGYAAPVNSYGGYEYMYDPAQSNIKITNPDIMNKINPKTGRPIGRDLEELQNPLGFAPLNPEFLRRQHRDNAIYLDGGY